MPFQRAKTTMERSIVSDPQEALPSTIADFGTHGSVLLQQAHFAIIGVREDNAGGKRIILAAGRNGCTCGCGALGQAYASTPSPDEARQLAAQLVAYASELEADAAKHAADLIGRAAR